MPNRRQFIKGAVGSLTFIGILLSPLFSLIRLGIAKTKKIVLPKDTKRESLIGKNPADLDTRNLPITPLKDFGVMGPDDLEVDLGAWRLQVEGHVARPLSLTYDQMAALPSIERDVLLICPGVFANQGRWRGVSIGRLLKMAQVEEGVTHVTVRGPEGTYEKTERFPMTDILSDKVFLAYGVNGEKLPVRHGFPLRLVAEDFYGYEWVKYVYKVTAERIRS
jgi:DMSO/TMAO reductase YedYZ molybdopterin-dependent catalytic subunit